MVSGKLTINNTRILSSRACAINTLNAKAFMYWYWFKEALTKSLTGVLELFRRPLNYIDSLIRLEIVNPRL